MPSKNDQQYQDYMRDVQSYLQQVRNGRRVPAADPQDPRFSQSADDERQARKAGLGSFIQHGPPSPLFTQQQPADQQAGQPMPPPGGMRNTLMDWLDEKRGNLSRLFTTRGAAAPSPVWGFSNMPGR